MVDACDDTVARRPFTVAVSAAIDADACACRVDSTRLHQSPSVEDCDGVIASVRERVGLSARK
jgi:hypothetical protein